MGFLCLGMHTAAGLSVDFHSETDVPISAGPFTANGEPISISLQFPPRTGADLMVVRNTGIDFIDGTFSNLAHGETVSLSHDGVTYDFVANYFGGTGNDLVLMWKNIRLVGWGDNTNGLLGDGTFTSRAEPAPVTATGVLAGKTVIAMATGYYHSLALCSDGTLAAWGIGVYGNLGNGSTGLSNVPVAVDTTSNESALTGKTVIGVATGSLHSLALCSDGTLATWGANMAGQLGDGTQTNRSLPVKVDSGALAGKKVVGMAAGAAHSLALCSDGTVAAWGINLNGELGNNSLIGYQTQPVEVNTAPGVSALHGKTVIGVNGGDYSSLAWCSDGSAAQWGRSGATDVIAPASVAVSNVSGMAAGSSNWLALRGDGTVFTWGNGTGSAVPIPFSIPGPSAVGIATGMQHNLALLTDGTLFTWGNSDPIVLGNLNAMTEAGIRFSKLQAGQSRSHSLVLAAYPNPQAARRNWRQQWFGDPYANNESSVDGADPDHDGLQNLMEYALNLDPNAFTPAPMELQPAGSHLECFYTRSGIARAAGVTFQVEWSDDLTTWVTTEVIEEIMSNGGAIEHMKVTLPAGIGGLRFVRLRVQ